MERIHKYDNFYSDLRKRQKPVTKETLQRISDRIQSGDTEDKKIDGFDILRKMEETLEKLEDIDDPSRKGQKKYKLSDQQKEFWKEFLITCLPAIFDKHTLIQNMETLKLYYGFEDYYQLCLVLAPRKIGKTFFSTLFLIILAWSMPKVTIPIFSTGERASVSALTHCFDFATEIGKIFGKDIILRYASTERIVIRNAWGKESVINCYPANPKGVRGVTGDIAFCDEFAFMDETFIEEVVIPLLTKCSMLAITTRNKEESNFVNRLVDASKKTERPFMKLIAKKMVCDTCRDKGVVDQCDHMLAILPDWQNPQRIAQIQSILSKKSDTFFRETLGIDGMDSDKVFPQKYIDLLKNYNRISMNYSPDYIMLAVDPACGGIGSKFGVISSYYQDGNLIVIIFLFFFNINSREKINVNVV